MNKYIAEDTLYRNSFNRWSLEQKIQHRLELYNVSMILLMLTGTYSGAYLEDLQRDTLFVFVGRNFTADFASQYFQNGFLRHTDYLESMTIIENATNRNLTTVTFDRSEIEASLVLARLINTYGFRVALTLRDKTGEIEVSNRNRFLPTYCIDYWPYLADAIFYPSNIDIYYNKIGLEHLNLLYFIDKSIENKTKYVNLINLINNEYKNKAEYSSLIDLTNDEYESKDKYLDNMIDSLEKALILELLLDHDHGDSHYQMLNVIQDTLNYILSPPEEHTDYPMFRLGSVEYIERLNARVGH